MTYYVFSGVLNSTQSVGCTVLYDWTSAVFREQIAS